MRRPLAAAVLGLGIALGVGACSPAISEVAEAGYQAGDGSFTTWADSERTSPLELSGTTFQGETVDVADWRGDVVLLNFWYAGCPPCRAEAPDLADVAADYPEVHLLGVNPRDDAPTAEAFERTYSVPYPSLWDDDAAAVAALEGVVPLQAMPTTVLLDRQGRVAARIIGQADPTILRGLIDDLLAEA